MLTGQDPDLNIAKILACKLYSTILEKLEKSDKNTGRKLSLAFLYFHQNKQNDYPEFTDEFKKTVKIPPLMTECPIWPSTLGDSNNLRVISAWTQAKTNKMIKNRKNIQFLKDTTPEKKALDNLQNMKGGKCPAFVIFGKTSPCYYLGSDSCADKFIEKRREFYTSCPDTKFFFYIHNPPEWEMAKQKLSDDGIKTIFAKKTTV